MKSDFQSIDDYISTFAPEIQLKLQQMRSVIQQAAPDASEAISYGMPTFKLNGNLVHFAAHKNHLGFYPLPKVIEDFKEQLVGYQTSKGAIQFPYTQPLPVVLIEEIVKARVLENSQKATVKGIKAGK